MEYLYFDRHRTHRVNVCIDRFEHELCMLSGIIQYEFLMKHVLY